MNFFRRQQHNNNNNNDTTKFHEQAVALIPAEIRMISGCHSEQTSADVSNASLQNNLPNPAGRAGGACTSALLEILYRNKNNNITFQELLFQLRDSLVSSGYSQVPQLTSSRPLELQNTIFTLGGNNNKRALLVGINYIGQNGELRGCHNDVYNVKQYLVSYHGYRERDIQILVDDYNNRSIFPTRQKIISALQYLVQSSVAGDAVYFHYSGHGGLLEPNAFRSSSKKDYDETLFPLDFDQSGQIRDYSLYQNFVQPMPAGVVVTCVMDCCHSGSVLDLPYSFQPTHEVGDRSLIPMGTNTMDLSNLAFLYILMGGTLPGGGLFDSVTDTLQSSLGDGFLEDYQGTGMGNEEMMDQFTEGGEDTTAPYGEDEDIARQGENFNYYDDNDGGGEILAPPADAQENFGYNNNNNYEENQNNYEESQNYYDVGGDEGEEATNLPDCGSCIADVLNDLLSEGGEEY